MNEESLQEIRKKLNAPFFGADLWDVLTALRGPDAGDDAYDTIKAATSCVIRYYFLGKPSIDTHCGSLVYPDSQLKAETRKKLGQALSNFEGPKCGEHFVQHAQKAFRALGLKWDEVNT